MVDRLRSVLGSLSEASKTLPLDATGLGGPELEAFEVRMTAGGRSSLEAASGEHDDTVLSLALAVWTAEKRRSGPFLFAPAGSSVD